MGNCYSVPTPGQSPSPEPTTPVVTPLFSQFSVPDCGMSELSLDQLPGPGLDSSIGSSASAVHPNRVPPPRSEDEWEPVVIVTWDDWVGSNTPDSSSYEPVTPSQANVSSHSRASSRSSHRLTTLAVQSLWPGPNYKDGAVDDAEGVGGVVAAHPWPQLGDRSLSLLCGCPSPHSSFTASRANSRSSRVSSVSAAHSTPSTASGLAVPTLHVPVLNPLAPSSALTHQAVF